MPTLALKAKLLIIIVLVAMASFGGYTAYVYHKGGSAAETKIATKALKHHLSVKKANEKIDHDTPYGADEPTAIDWLYRHCTSY